MKKFSSLTLFSAAIFGPLFTFATPPAPPAPPNGSWGNYVYFYTQGSYATAQTDIDAVFQTNGGATGEFANQGYAFLFAPGTYTSLNLRIGYYTSIMGLGVGPFNTQISSVNSYSEVFISDPCVGSLRSYWRSAENFTSIPAQPTQADPNIIGMVWAASHGSSLRNMIVSGRLYLSDQGPATGAFAANCLLQNFNDPNPTSGSAVYSGTQQQLIIRNANVLNVNQAIPAWNTDSGAGSAWAQTFVGCTGVPASQCGNCNGGQIPGQSIGMQLGCTCTNSLCGTSPAATACTGLPANNIPIMPKSAEKPFITYTPSGSYFTLVVPIPKTGTVGAQLPDIDGETISFDDVYVATPSDSVETINAMLNTYSAVILTPGTYNLPSPITITQPNQVLLGIGYPILIPTQQNACVLVGNVSGVRVAGLLLQAGATNASNYSDSLLQWGTSPNTSTTDGYLSDCYARAGLFALSPLQTIAVKKMFSILSSNVVCDNVWAWRADYDFFGPINSPQRNVPLTSCANGMQIQGSGVISYGLSCENMNGLPNAPVLSATKNLLEWNGDGGQCYSYQGTFPVDGSNLFGNDYGASGYVLGIDVTEHTAYDVGIYSRIANNNVYVYQGIQAPNVPLGNNTPVGIAFFSAFTRILSGNATINSVINGRGLGGGFTSGMPIISLVNAMFPGPTYVMNCQFGKILTNTSFPNK